VVEPKDPSRIQSGATEYRRRDARCGLPRRLTAGLVIAAGLVLGACSIPFGQGAESTGGSSEETPRDRNRLYLQEQERMERKMQFDRVGPSDR
jgi:hypothetical protein